MDPGSPPRSTGLKTGPRAVSPLNPCKEHKGDTSGTPRGLLDILDPVSKIVVPMIDARAVRPDTPRCEPETFRIEALDILRGLLRVQEKQLELLQHQRQISADASPTAPSGILRESSISMRSMYKANHFASGSALRFGTRDLAEVQEDAALRFASEAEGAEDDEGQRLSRHSRDTGDGGRDGRAAKRRNQHSCMSQAAEFLAFVDTKSANRVYVKGNTTDLRSSTIHAKGQGKDTLAHARTTSLLSGESLMGFGTPATCDAVHLAARPSAVEPDERARPNLRLSCLSTMDSTTKILECPSGHPLELQEGFGEACGTCHQSFNETQEVMVCKTCAWWRCRECCKENLGRRTSEYSMLDLVRGPMTPGGASQAISMHWRSSADIPQDSPDIPQELPAEICAVLSFLGIVCEDVIQQRSLRYGYRIWYQLCVPGCMFFCVLLHLSDIAIRVLLGEAQDITNIFTLLGLMFAVVPGLHVLRIELSKTGAMCALMFHAERRGYTYHKGRFWARLTICLMFGAMAVWCAVALTTRRPPRSNGPPAVRVLGEVVRHCWFPVASVLWPITIGCIMLPNILADLHTHELLWYGYGLADTIENLALNIDPLPALKRTEMLITSRLRHASNTWVRGYLLTSAFLGLMFVTLITILLSGTAKGNELRLAVTLGFVMLSLALVLFPIANVAEVFEYDVLRALNNPMVVQRAQRLFGQQLIAHLHTLEWGFRAGGTVINMRLVMQLVTAVVVTAVTTVCQSVLDLTI